VTHKRPFWARWTIGAGVLLVATAAGISVALVANNGPSAAPSISADESWSHVGQESTVRFVVQSTHLQGNRELLNALNGSSFPYGFSVILSDSVVRQAEHDPAEYDFGHTVSVEGRIRMSADRPVILVTDPGQISAAN
jgi:hypothetical protein